MQFQDAAAIRVVPKHLSNAVTWRLMQDARMYPQHRDAIVPVLKVWDTDPQPSIGKAERMLWKNDVEQGIVMLRKLMEASNDQFETAKLSAQLLQRYPSEKSLSEAVRIWDQLAARSSKGGQVWHHAKLSGIDALIAQGAHDEAIRRAKYVLLTTPNIKQELKERYQATVQ